MLKPRENEIERITKEIIERLGNRINKLPSPENKYELEWKTRGIRSRQIAVLIELLVSEGVLK